MLYKLLTGAAPQPGHHGETQVGIAKVPDARLNRLTAMYNPKKKTPATVEYLDLAGVEKGQAAKALPLDKLRTADAPMWSRPATPRVRRRRISAT